MVKDTLKGLILMGGQSTRMGHDKAFVHWKGKTLLEHAIHNLQELVSDVYLSVNTEQLKRLSPDYHCIEDLYPDKGPMGGILSGLQTLQESLLVVAVDMPGLSSSALKSLVNDASKVSAFKNQDQKWEPLPSYWPAPLVSELESHLMDDELSLSSFLDIHGQSLASKSNSTSFRNLNSPTDLY